MPRIKQEKEGKSYGRIFGHCAEARRAGVLMAVTCRVHECAFWMNAKPEQEQDEKRGMMGFCKNPIHTIDRNGGCGYLRVMNRYVQNGKKPPKEFYERELNVQDAEIVGEAADAASPKEE